MGLDRPVSPNPYDLHALARLRAGIPLDGSSGSVSEPFRPIVDHLADLDPTDRGKALDGFLKAPGLDSAWMVQALTNLDP